MTNRKHIGHQLVGFAAAVGGFGLLLSLAGLRRELTPTPSEKLAATYASSQNLTPPHIPAKRDHAANARALASRLQQLMATVSSSDEAHQSPAYRLCQEMTLDTLDDYLALLDQPGLDALGYEMSTQLNVLVHQRWLELDAPAAARHARANWSPATQHQFLPDLFDLWSSRDAPAALRHYQILKLDLTIDDSALIALLRGSATSNFDYFCRELASFPPSDSRNTALNQALTQLMQHQSTDALIETVSHLPDRGLFNEALFQVLTSAAEADARIIPYLGPFFQSAEPDQQALRDALFQKWNSAAPAEAAAWLDRHADSLPTPHRQRYYQTMISAAASRDLLSAESWLAARPNDGRFDLAITSVARRVRSTDEGRAEAWLHFIQDPSVRAQAATLLTRDAYAAANPPDHD